jgi:hypothetical protein
MNCVRCGSPALRHVKADGSCLDCPCPGFLAAWPDETKGEGNPLPTDAPHAHEDKTDKQ